MAHEDTARETGLKLVERAKRLLEQSSKALEQATGPDHKLAVIANYGDIALSLLSLICDEYTSALQAAAAEATERAAKIVEGASERYASEGEIWILRNLAAAIRSPSHD